MDLGLLQHNHMTLMAAKNSFDSIIIGSGLGGLTAGALMAKKGKRVCVLERHDKFGGAATSFSRGDLQFEVALHEIDGFDAGDPKMRLLSELRVLDHVNFLPVSELYEVRHPAFKEPYTMPHGIQEGIAEARRRFPKYTKELQVYFRALESIRRKGSIVAKNYDRLYWWLLNGPIFPFRFWPFLRHDRTTVGDFLDKLFGDDELVKIALCGNLLYYTDDPYSFSLLYHGLAQGSYHIGGGHYVQHGAQSISDYLVSLICESGGKAYRNRLVTNILVEGGRAIGVRHHEHHYPPDPEPKDAQEIFADVLIGNAAPHVLAGMLPDSHKKVFEQRYTPLPVSTALWNIYLAFNRKPNEYGVSAYSTFVYPGWFKKLRHMTKNVSLLGGKPNGKVPVYVFVDYSALDNRLNKDGNYTAVMTGFDNVSNWEGLDADQYQERKKDWLDTLVNALNDTYPGIKDAIVHKEMANARTLQGYLNTPNGAVYGYAQTPSNSGWHRPRSRTPVSGLFLASAYASPGGGFTAVMLAGEAAARAANKSLRAL